MSVYTTTIAVARVLQQRVDLPGMERLHAAQAAHAIAVDQARLQRFSWRRKKAEDAADREFLDVLEDLARPAQEEQVATRNALSTGVSSSDREAASRLAQDNLFGGVAA